MNYLQVIFLGVLQGLTEFLPVSSSGHLVIAQSLISGFDQPGVLFDVVLHFATAVAIVIYFRERLLSLDLKEVGLLVVGSVPVLIVGLTVRSFVESLFDSVMVVGFALLLTAGLNFLTDRATGRRQVVGWIDAVFVGIFQAMAVVPGLSRSGSTIFAGTAMGVERKKAAEFSFLLSVPAIVGASLLEVISYGLKDGGGLGIYVVGFFASLAASIIGIGLVMRVLTERRFKYFAGYCLVVGLGVLLFL